jgi:PfaB family protein
LPTKPRIAIVSLGAVFPNMGGADPSDLSAFWDMLREGRSAARTAPPGRWTIEPDQATITGHVQTPPEPDRVASPRACFVNNFTLDPAGLDADPDLLDRLDPVYRIGLAAARDAWNSAQTESLDRTRVGVVIGNIALPTDASSAIADEILTQVFEDQLLGVNPLAGGRADNHLTTEPLNRYVTGLPGGLIAKALGLGAGAWTLDAACASSLYALKFAADELIAGRADAMLAGGLSRPDSLYTQMGFSQLGACSPTGVCSPFDRAADGLVVGEGCGIVVLKRLDDARRDGDTIFATIEGVGLSNDIGGSLFSPDSEGQLRAMRQAYADAGWRPDDVDHIECHGTGTPVGDAVECTSLRNLWREAAPEPDPGAHRCVIGSVKSNVGHLLTAAGSAGLIKTLLAMKHGALPPTANFNTPGDKLGLTDSPFEVLAEARDWPRPADHPRRAACSAFGFGGINAHVLLEQWEGEEEDRAEVDHPEASASDEPVAIVGLGAHIGPWKTRDQFAARVLGAGPDVPPSTPTHWWGAAGDCPATGHWITRVDTPVNRFRIPPAELRDMLPQQLLMLDAAAQAFDDAGLGDPVDRRLDTGVFIGLGLDLNTTNYHFRWAMKDRARRWATLLGRELTDAQLDDWIDRLRDAAYPPLTANRTMGNLGGIVASRVARAFRVGGPSFTISSEETSGLHALYAATGALRRGEIDVALTGAVDLAGDVRAAVAQAEGVAGRPWSPSGQMKPFDPDADGAVIGEGAVALVLKRYSDAQRDGDTVYGLIRAFGSAHGGGAELQTSTADAYRRSLDRACVAADVDPTDISAIETHGSSFAAEDNVEAAAIAEWLSDRATCDRQPRLALGSAKADVGHTGCAAALVSVAKAALQLRRQALPTLRGAASQQPSHPELEPVVDRIHTPTAPQHWLVDANAGPRRCAVASMSVDGNCVHAILEEAPSPDTPSKTAPPVTRGEGLFVVREENIAPLLGRLDELEAWLEGADTSQPVDTLAARWCGDAPVIRPAAETGASNYAVAMIADSPATLRDLITEARRSVKKGLPQRGPRLFFSPEPIGADPGAVAFVFPGSGNHFAGMGRGMAAAWPSVMRRFEAENERLSSQFAGGRFWSQDNTADLSHKDVIFGQVWLGALVSDVLRACGAEPAAVLGYSLGETTAQFATRSWTGRDDMLTRMDASTLFTEDLSGRCESVRRAWNLNDDEEVDWLLGVVDRSADAVNVAIEGHPRVYLLIVNTPGECVIGGDRQAVLNLVEALGSGFHPVSGVTTVHSPVARPVADDYRDLHLFDVNPLPGVSYYSGVREGKYDVTTDSVADSILGQAVGPFDFTKVIEAAYADGVRLFIETGPGATCSRMIDATLGDRPHAALSACVAGQDEVLSVLGAIATLVAEGAEVDLDQLHATTPPAPIDPSAEDRGPVVTVKLGGEPFVVPPPPEEIPEGILADAPESELAPEPTLEPTMTHPGHTVSGSVPNAIPTPPTIPTPPPTPSVTPTPSILTPAAVTSGGADLLTPVITQMAATETAHAQAQKAFLKVSQGISQTLSQAIAMQAALIEGDPGAVGTTVKMPTIGVPSQSYETISPHGQPEFVHGTPSVNSVVDPSAIPTPPAEAPLYDYDMCMEFAVGSIGKMLGPGFAHVDSHPTRVRLPDEPLMLAHRIMEIEGEPNSMTSGRVVTQHDVAPGAWYLDGGRIPTCIAVEAGQADLFLSGYLGIDSITRGLAVYRLLDAAITFHAPLPRPGATISYDIRIHGFFRQGDTHLFRFGFEGTVDGRPLLTMEEGVAGFFTQDELDAGRGVVLTSMDTQPMPGKRPSDWDDLVPMGVESYDENQINALRHGDYVGCFGAAFAGLALQQPVGLPSGRMTLVHRILELDPTGGRFGIGRIVGEADIHPDDWFLTCHFVDDKVMPGTLMYECCLHTLRVHLLRMGWVGEDAELAYEPIPGVKSTLQCRGQVLDTTKKVQYEITLKEIGYTEDEQTPFVIADALMYGDGKPIVQMKNMSVRLTGLTRGRIETIWANQTQTAPAPAAAGETGGDCPVNTHPAPPIYDDASITAFAIGKPSEAFGDRYKVFDNERKIARLPGPPYKFLDRVTSIEGCQPWVLEAGGVIEAQYDVPPDGWYFDADRQGAMPFSVLLEVALQPCGWLAAYLGSALTSETDLSFRNLGGSATQHLPVRPDTGTLTTRVAMTRVSMSGGMIIQNYDMETWCKDGLVYKGDTYFGFFAAEALANQIGIQDAKPYEPTQAERDRGSTFIYPDAPPFPDAMLRMVNDIEMFVPDGGPHGLGFVRGTMDVDPGAWFFKAHFYQDPVVPGSLGLESMIQLLKVAAHDRWHGSTHPEDVRFEALAPGQKHEWVYRGQVIPRDHRVTVQAVITRVDDAQQILWADGYLMVDGRIIYHMRDFALRMFARQ